MADSPNPQAGRSCGDISPPSHTGAGFPGGPAETDAPGPPAPHPIRPRPPRNGLGIAALTLAVLGLLILATLGVVGSTGPARVFFWVAGFLTTLSLALGILGARRAKQGYAGNRGRCLTGAVLGGLATVWCINGAVAATDPFHQVSCQAGQQQTTASSGAKAGASPSPKPKAAGAPGSGPVSFDTTWCFKNGVQVTVSAPKPYTPRTMRHDWQRGYTPGNRTRAVEVTIRNGSTNMVDLEELISIGATDANGRGAQAVFEGEDPSRGLGKTLLLPGMKKVMTQGFALPPSAAKRMGVEVSLNVAADRRALWSGPDESARWSGRMG
ncbi:hypothetical protein [Streptomyces sp. NPDC048516]|uniref:hypothetical protein n=1 Tax=Streptomyces sp. NPDC048516 TaxID=3365565 RepID=UPI00371943CF